MSPSNFSSSSRGLYPVIEDPSHSNQPPPAYNPEHFDSSGSYLPIKYIVDPSLARPFFDPNIDHSADQNYKSLSSKINSIQSLSQLKEITLDENDIINAKKGFCNNLLRVITLVAGIVKKMNFGLMIGSFIGLGFSTGALALIHPSRKGNIAVCVAFAVLYFGLLKLSMIGCLFSKVAELFFERINDIRITNSLSNNSKIQILNLQIWKNSGLPSLQNEIQDVFEQLKKVQEQAILQPNYSPEIYNFRCRAINYLNSLNEQLNRYSKYTSLIKV